MMETIKPMYFWLNYSEKNNQIEKIPIAVENVVYL